MPRRATRRLARCPCLRSPWTLMAPWTRSNTAWSSCLRRCDTCPGLLVSPPLVGDTNWAVIYRPTSDSQVERPWPESSYFLLSGKRNWRAACRVEAVRLAIWAIPRRLTAETRRASIFRPSRPVPHASTKLLTFLYLSHKETDDCAGVAHQVLRDATAVHRPGHRVPRERGSRILHVRERGERSVLPLATRFSHRSNLRMCELAAAPVGQPTATEAQASTEACAGAINVVYRRSIGGYGLIVPRQP